jgi:hypothetical protein
MFKEIVTLHITRAQLSVLEDADGGAHLVMEHRIDDHFTIGVPSVRAINPVSKKINSLGPAPKIADSRLRRAWATVAHAQVHTKIRSVEPSVPRGSITA